MRSVVATHLVTRILAILAVIGLLAAMPAAASAAPVERFTDQHTSLFCDELTAGDGTVFLFADVSEQFGSFSSLAFWDAGSDPFIDLPSVVSASAEVMLSGDTLTVDYELWTFDPGSDPPLGELLGTATLVVTLTPIGDPEPFVQEFREGNRLIRVEGVRQALSVEGNLDLLGTIVDLSGCSALHESITFFGTNPAGIPASFVFHSEQINLSCHWETPDGVVDLFAVTDEFGTFSDIFLPREAGFIFGFAEDPVLTTTQYSADFVLELEGGGPVGTATADATLTPTGERERFIDRQAGFSFKFHGELISVDGALELSLDGSEPINLVMDDENCMASVGRSTFQTVTPKGPKPEPLPNDTPEGAEPIEFGRTVRIVTGGLAPEPEAPCIVVDPVIGEQVEVPITFTAWWTFTGTGGEVTVSTAGSYFDTILGVYQLVDDELVQVACVDDVFEPEFSLLAEVTVETQDGATYYIQAGGFAGSSGRLVLTVE